MKLSTTTNSPTFHSEPEMTAVSSSFWAVAPPTLTVAPAGPGVSRRRSTSATVLSLSGVLGRHDHVNRTL